MPEPDEGQRKPVRLDLSPENATSARAVAAATRPNPATMPTANVGGAGDDQLGQLGSGVGSDHSWTMFKGLDTAPSAVKIVAGRWHFAALYPDGRVTAWGQNCYGALGIGYANGRCQHVPTLALISGVAAMAAGNDHTVYVGQDGTLAGVGTNGDGALGGAAALGQRRFNPTPIPFLAGPAVDVAASSETTYVLTEAGEVWAFGGNKANQLGTGSAMAYSTTPSQVVGLTNIVDISSRPGIGFALKSDGTVWQWGNDAGSPTPIQVQGLAGIAELGASTPAFGLLGLAIRDDGSLWSWSGTSVATQVPGVSNVVAAAASYGGTAATAQGAVYSWGPNYTGQVGNGTRTAEEVTPVKAIGVRGAVDVAVAGETTVLVADISPPPGAPLSLNEMIGGGNPSLNCDCAQAMRADPINTAFGTFHETEEDIAFSGRGPGLTLGRTYDSGAANVDSNLGYGWRSSLGMKVASSGDSAVVTQENGSEVGFSLVAGLYVAPPRMLANLTKNSDGSWRFTRHKREIFDFDAQGRLSAIRDLNGYATTLAYAGSTITATDAAGRGLRLTLSSGRVVTATDLASPNRSWGYGYDGSGNLTSVTNPANEKTTYGYNGQHLMTSFTTPANQAGGAATVNVFDSQGRVTSQTDPLGRTTTFEYVGETAAGLPYQVKTTEPDGAVTRDDYGRDNLRVQEIRGYGSSPSVTRFYYDPRTLSPTAKCDGAWRCDTYEYGENGDLLRETDPVGNSTRYTHNSLGQVVTEVSATGLTTTKEYDGAGNVLSQTATFKDPVTGADVAPKTTFGYGGGTPVRAGDITSVTDPSGHTEKLAYDGAGNLTARTAPPTAESPTGNKTTYGYDARGNLTSVVRPKGNVTGATPAAFTTSMAYDAVDRLIATRDPLWNSGSPSLHQSQNEFDADGDVIGKTGPDGKRTVIAFDVAGQQTSVTKPGGAITKFRYTAAGRLGEREDELGRITSYGYDVRGNQTTATDPSGRTTTFEYDATNQVVRRQDGDGSCDGAASRCAEYSYDDAARLTQVHYPSGATPDVANIEYDGANRRTGLTDATGNTSLVWDPLGRLRSVVNGSGSKVAYDYDLRGFPVKLVYPNNLAVTRVYDGAGRMASTKDWLGNTTTFSYDANGNLAGQVFPTASATTDAYTYSNADAMLTATTKKASTVLASFTYSRDGANRMATQTTAGITEPAQTFGYSDPGELTRSGPTATPVAHKYDLAGQLTARATASTQTYDAAGQLCWSTATTVASPSCTVVPSGAARFTFDASGNRTSRIESGGATTQYAYDDNSRLKSYVGTSGTTTYRQDSDGLRAAKVKGSTATGWGWDKTTFPARLLTDGASYYVHGPGGRVIEQISGSTATYLHQDQLGSTRLITSAAGAAVGSYTFDAYGVKTAGTGTATSPIGFAGHYTDSESGLVYMQARSYDPTTGQFLSQDPLLDVSGQAYAYTKGDPVNFVDPDGRFLIAIPFVAAAVVEAAAWTVATVAAVAGTVAAVNALKDHGVGVIGGGEVQPLSPPSDFGISIQDCINFAKKSKESAKARSTEIPEWAKHAPRESGETQEEWASRVLDEKYGPGNWKKGAGTEHSKLRKWNRN